MCACNHGKLLPPVQQGRSMKLTLLGTGSSTGVPELGCKCAVCISANPKNKRMRTSALFEVGDKKILIDTSPDLRQQALTNKIFGVDAILFTHTHADHTNGIDDVKLFVRNQKCEIPAFGDADTMAEIKRQFGYAFMTRPPEYAWYYPALIANEVAPTGKFIAAEVEVVAFRQGHGRGHSLGFRIGNVAYSTDCNFLPDESFKALEGLDAWVVDCLRLSKAPTHANLEMTLGWIERVKPKRAILTHMAHDIDYDYIKSLLPDGVEPGYDGMVIC